MRHKIKAAFFDIDGTLVSFQTHQIPASTIHAMRIAKENGVKLFISTGRPIGIVNNIDAVKHLIGGYITFNGAYSFIGNEDINIDAIDKRDVDTMLADAKAKDYTVLVCSRNDIVIYNHHSVFDEVFVEGLGVNNLDPYKDMSVMEGQPVLQLTPFIPQDVEKPLMEKITSCVSARWNPMFTDITAVGSDKGNALDRIVEHEDFTHAECIAFGDGGNDKTILAKAGIGVAMGNAADDVKEVADYITSSVDEGGIWNALRHFEVI